MSYQLIALDLDGTLLNSQKIIPEETFQAVRAVCEAGKTVTFNTGRAVPELAEQIALLPEVHYAVFASGAGICQIPERKTIGLHGLSAPCVKRILSFAQTKDIMPQLVLPDADVIQASHMQQLEHFHMGIYRPMYEKAMTLVPDVWTYAENCRDLVLKINLYHAEPAERIHSREQLMSPDLELVFAEASSLECSSGGVSKGSGLERLCRLLNVPAESCIAVGDSDNDIPMFRSAGLSVAMGNAPEHVKAAADRVVSDLDHGGCAQAIRMLME